MSPPTQQRARSGAWERRLPGRLRSLVHRLRGDDILLTSAALAFYALVSSAPLAIVSVWLVGHFIGPDAIRAAAESFSRSAPGGIDVTPAANRLVEEGARLGWSSLLAALWPATAYGAGLTRAFDRLSDEPDREAKGLRGRVLALSFVALAPLFGLLGLAATYAGTRVLGDGATGQVLGWVLAFAAAYGSATLLSALVYRLFTPDPVGWRRVFRGAFSTAGTTSLLSVGYVGYVTRAADFEARYAGSAIASLVLFAVWLFLANALLLAGYQTVVAPPDDGTGPDPERAPSDRPRVTPARAP